MATPFRLGDPRSRALFGPADARGNNPHGTRESADHEGRRRNAGRYETAEQLDRAFDARAGLGAVEPGAASGILGLLAAALAVGAVAVLVSNNTRRRVVADDDDDDDDIVDSEVVRSNPGRPLLQNPMPPAQVGMPVMYFVQPSSLAGALPPGMSTAPAAPAQAPLALPAPPPSPPSSEPVKIAAEIQVVDAPAAKPKRKFKNKGQFTPKTAKKARARVVRPGPKPKTAT